SARLVQSGRTRSGRLRGMRGRRRKLALGALSFALAVNAALFAQLGGGVAHAQVPPTEVPVLPFIPPPVPGGGLLPRHPAPLPGTARPADIPIGVAPGSPLILRGPDTPGNAPGASPSTPPPVYAFPVDAVPPAGSWPLPPVPVTNAPQPVQVPPFTAPL